jgi:hypothetical protein
MGESQYSHTIYYDWYNSWTVISLPIIQPRIVCRTIPISSVEICRKPRMTPSRDYDEQRLGILYSLLKSEYLR